MVLAPGYSASSVMIGLVPVPKSPKNHAGTSPITNASDRNRVVLARVARHRLRMSTRIGPTVTI
jgi:hypothetical protein